MRYSRQMACSSQSVCPLPTVYNLALYVHFFQIQIGNACVCAQEELKPFHLHIPNRKFRESNRRQLRAAKKLGRSVILKGAGQPAKKRAHFPLRKSRRFAAGKELQYSVSIRRPCTAPEGPVSTCSTAFLFFFVLRSERIAVLVLKSAATFS